MEQMSFKQSCLFHSKGMWLLLAATTVACFSLPAQLYPLPHSEQLNANSTLSSYLSSPSSPVTVKGLKEDSANLSQGYTEESTLLDSNTTEPISSNTIDDLLEVTSAIVHSVCALCLGLEYNVTEWNNTGTLNSSSYLLSSTTKQESRSFFNVGVIIGIAILVIVIVTLIGVLSFFAYRHFSWNRPQTLTDKFSNDESTGYIDDTAFRENSEEMYSLDNDSFLNSLEAMTIQNYWTDHVRHTKL